MTYMSIDMTCMSVDMTYMYMTYMSVIVKVFISISLVRHVPRTSTWPQLRCDVGLEEGEYQ